ncbi:M16 family metallopeptidase [Dinghuibacter silviterrae]|uniref:Putative Zn-dependent peptidase n=1 Tax=Dinghuibacter silviterrae TaxID=1539049 RepID=A0A4R8DPJ3_9BACT|nr:pitrilysin family protein [Dinghuibacter silviterrae]TDW99655.1 putative Zn-dependent peptidase [Dinghuibacter silviterrae]
MLNRTQAPRLKDAVDYSLSLKPYRFFRLTNGVEVYAVDAGPQDVLQMEMVFDAGNAFENQALVAASTNYLLKNGTAGKNAFALNEHFEYYGAYLNRHCYGDTGNLVLHTLTKNLGELLPVMREILTECTFPDEELNTYRQNMLQRLAVNLKKPDFVAGRLIDVSLFGQDHPYGRFSTPEGYAALHRDLLVDFYQRHYVHGRCRIFVAGRVPADIDSLLERNFGDLSLSSAPVARRDFAIHPATERVSHLVNDPEGIQGAIRIASPFPDKHHPDFSKVQVLNTVFGGYFGSRLMSNIREEKGYTYGIHSYLQGFTNVGAWMISTEAGRDVSEAAVKEVYHEMERLREEPVEEEELHLVRNYMIGTLLGDLDGPFQIIGRWKNIILHGLDTGYFDRAVEITKTITAAELQELAQKYLVPERFYELIVV